MTIVEAAEAVLRDAAGPLYVRVIYNEILRRGIYSFDTPDPVGILARKLREQTSEDPRCANPRFLKIAPNTFSLAEWREDEEGENSFQEVVNRLALGLEEELAADVPVPKLPCRLRSARQNYRNPKISASAIALARHSCEERCGVPLFVRGGSQYGYVEAHHLVPLFVEAKFSSSLDVRANVLALCPRCHALVHHGSDKERLPVIARLHASRIERLASSGISVGLEQLLLFYGIGKKLER